MAELSATVNIKLMLREGETQDAAENRLSDILWEGLCQLADHHVDFWVEEANVID